MKHKYYFPIQPGFFALLTAAILLWSCGKRDTPIAKPYSFTLGYSKTFGGTSDESARSVNAPGGGIVLAGTTRSHDGDVHGSHGNSDAWIIKLNSVGDTIWSRTIGGSGDDEAAAIGLASDGGYIITGSTDSQDGDITDKRAGSGRDAWIIKLEDDGRTSWSKTYGGSGSDAGFAMAIAPDGGYVIAGVTGSIDGDVTDNHGGGDVWAFKLDNRGRLQWSKTYGGSSWDQAHRIVATTDGYVMAGLTYSNDGDITGYHTSLFTGGDMLVVKIDPSGRKIWAKAFGGTLDEDATALVTTTGGYVVAGYANSADGDVTGVHGKSALFYDMWVLKLETNGNILWAKAFGGSFDDAATSIAATPDGGFVVAGGAGSNDGDVIGKHTEDGGAEDAWIVKLDAGGNKQWTKILGGSGDDIAYSISVDPDGYTITGSTSATDGDVGGQFKGVYDIWAAKILVH